MGQPLNTGLVSSLTVMVCVQLAGLLQESLTDQVRVIVIPLHTVPLVCSSKAGVRAPSQLSVAVTVALAGTSARHWTLTVWAGQPLNTGAVVSLTVITWEQVYSTPQSSVAVQSRIIVLLQLEP